MEIRTKGRLRTLSLASALFAGAAPTPLLAQRVISDEESNPVRTSVDGDVTIQEEATLDVAGAAPITIDSSNSVTIEENATVQADDANNRAGLVVAASTDALVSNAGDIFVTEGFVAEDDDNNGIADGPIAEATNRYGIQVLSGGLTSGTIENSGDITVEGLSSFGISVEGDYTGTINNSGNVLVVGDNSLAISTQSINGDLVLGGNVQSVGEGAQTVLIDGDISGALTVNGTLSNSSSFTNEDGFTLTLSRSDLRDGSAAVEVRGNVNGGIILEGRPFDLDPDNDDEDGDGVDDLEETVGRITNNNESPALLIGSDQNITVGTVEGRDGAFSLVVDGSISSSSIYSSFDSIGVVIGGQGGTVDLTGGIGVSGSISARTVDSLAVAILINEGVNAPTLDNSGEISAELSSSGEGSVIALQDLSGTLATINNSGFITADGSNEDTAIALDLSANTSGVTITQFLNELDAETRAELEAEEDYDFENPAVFTSITGDVVTGTGDDTIDIQTGVVRGDAFLGAGDDSVTLSDNARYDGDISPGSGSFSLSLFDEARFEGTINAANENATVTISDQALYSGTFEDAGSLSVNVEGGTLEAPEGQIVMFDELLVGSQGVLAVTISEDDDTQSGFVVNEATFAEGAQVSADVQSITGVEGSYTILTADNIEGTPQLAFAGEALPFLFTGELVTTESDITLDLRTKTPEELGLSQPQSQAYNELINQALEIDLLEQSFLDAQDAAQLQEQFEGLLPDYNGGAFDFVSRASRQFTKNLSDGKAFYDVSPVGGWLEPIYFEGSKNTGETADFSNDGWGISAGLERDFGFGYLGLGLGYASGTITNTDRQEISSSVIELSGHWRMRSKNFHAFAKVSGLRPSFSSTRAFVGEIDETEFAFTTIGEWDAWAASATGGLSYELPLTRSARLRPKMTFDYFWMQEDGYQEEGAEEIDLLVEDRTSSAATGTVSMVASYSLGRQRSDGTPLTLEIEGGWRSILIDNLGDTTASFLDADPFTVTPEALSDGWVSEARLKLGGFDYLWQLGIGAEQIQGDIDISARFSLSVAL
ncbi:MAG: autotransporter outer membrane beta-barrel domain-containing protein [Pseudomonadota bacterium]